MEFETLLFEKDGGVATVTMNRPKELNAFNIEMGRDLVKAFEVCEDDPGIRAVILTGAGQKAFCAGGDIKYMAEGLEKGSAHDSFRQLTKFLNLFIGQMRRLPKPVIAAVNGYASGAGFSFVLAADLALAAQEAKFNQAYVGVGLCPDGASTLLLPFHVGVKRAARLIFTGEMIDADTARDWGIVDQVAHQAQVLPDAVALAKKLAAGPTVAIGTSKRLLNEAMGDIVEQHLERERRGIIECSKTEDFKEGLGAFLGKRKADFKGR